MTSNKQTKINPYERFSEEDLILRDHLAMDRTILANERTFLSYIRTSLAVIVVGATVIHFFKEDWARAGGVALTIVGMAILAIGYVRYRKTNILIKQRR